MFKRYDNGKKGYLTNEDLRQHFTIDGAFTE